MYIYNLTGWLVLPLKLSRDKDFKNSDYVAVDFLRAKFMQSNNYPIHVERVKSCRPVILPVTFDFKFVKEL